MLEINILFKSMNVESYEPKEGAKVKIIFNDGLRDRIFMKSFSGGKVVSIGESIIKDIRDFENKENPTDPEDPFDTVNVKFDNEEKLAEKLDHFFEKIANEIKYVKSYNSGESYLGIVSKLRNIKTNF